MNAYAVLPRPEYPRPQFVRDNWLCLNGEWQFEIDSANTGLARGLREKPALDDRITVPFCPESTLSGIGHVDFMEAVWYRREIAVPAEWAAFPRLRLHFQACDYDATVWVNGQEVVRHRGGFTPFWAEIGGLVKAGETATVVVRARDRNRTEAQPGGKQSVGFANAGCHYTRTTGIWQTVWLEPLPATSFERPRITPDLAHRRFRLELPLSGDATGLRVEAVLRDAEGVEVSRASIAADADFTPSLDLDVPPDRLHLWGPGDGYLYGVELRLVAPDGAVVDAARSYAGMRSVSFRGKAVLVNGKPVFQRQVLDQGYYPDGIMTAPSDEALVRDIELSMAAGFNAARLHQKVFEERFLYHADRLGYLVWGEFGDWGVRENVERCPPLRHQPFAALMAQWSDVVARDYSHPSIIGWCPLNETWRDISDEYEALDDMTRGLYAATKNADRSRPVLDASGYSHRQPFADIYDCHDYDQNPETFRARHDALREGKPYVNKSWNANDPAKERDWSLPYAGQPYFVSEFGGIRWAPAEENSSQSWGYGNAPKTIDEYMARFEGLTAALLDNPDMFGYCYTQLTDVFQEQNGIYMFDRTEKFDLARIRAAQTRVAAIERRP